MTELTTTWRDGVPPEIDSVADAGPVSHRFLRAAWFGAAAQAYGKRVTTLLVGERDRPLLALPLAATGPHAAGIGMVVGSYWPLRTFVMVHGAEPPHIAAMLRAAFAKYRAIRVGPLPADDWTIPALLRAASEVGCVSLRREVGCTWLLDLGEAHRGGGYPRPSTLKKNRYHERQLQSFGALEWRTISGADWPGALPLLATIEENSWLADETDGSDAKFTTQGHGRFWAECVRDPTLAEMLGAATLHVGGEPAAFSFDLRAGPTCHAIANSYDRRFERHSPGKILYYRNLASLAEQGVENVDWGVGDSGYKQTLGARRGPQMVDLLIVRPGLASLVARLMAHARRSAWRVADRV
ncbi:GNAT family N-acetyltransferase [Sphingomonas sp.]|uniref:GNAT family N-acetyltransferase n=1 Tax=Sphingomonas sp. TaxID=28214 RepID=UPI00257E2967|nr:GNAT family N-acetyltransferase [Sphingomonas sp.]